MSSVEPNDHTIMVGDMNAERLTSAHRREPHRTVQTRNMAVATWLLACLALMSTAARPFAVGFAEAFQSAGHMDEMLAIAGVILMLGIWLLGALAALLSIVCSAVLRNRSARTHWHELLVVLVALGSGISICSNLVSFSKRPFFLYGPVDHQGYN